MTKYYRLKSEEVMDSLATSVDGLSSDEVRKRFKEYGPNKLPRQRRFSFLKLFLSQFKSPFTIILGVAGAVSLFFICP